MFQPITKINLTDEEILSIRKELYHSEGAGYFIFKGFLSHHEIEHMRHVWTEYDWRLTHRKFLGKANLTLQSPEQYYWDEKRRTESYWNFYWNTPKRCTYTQETCASIHVLRNLISGRAPFYEFAVSRISGHDFVAAYRIVNTLETDTYMEEHVDWGPQDDIKDKRYQPARLQCSLFLAEHGTDYIGDGFYLTNKKGEKLYIGKDIGIKAGDLVLWPFNSPHGVGSVKALTKKIGMLRIMFPSEKIDTSRVYSPLKDEIISL